MLYNIQLIIISAGTIGAFFAGMYIYRAGYTDGRQDAGDRIPERKPVLPNLSKKAPEPAENSPYYDDLLYNIEIYDGTPNGQREVRSK